MKKFIRIEKTDKEDNPCGAKENSAQTIHRKAKEAIDDQHNTVYIAAQWVNAIWSGIGKGFLLLFRVGVIPALLIFIIGYTLLALNMGHSGGAILEKLIATPEFLLLNILPRLMTALLPIIIIAGCGLLFFFLVSGGIASSAYPDKKDAVKRKEVKKAMFITQSALFFKGIGKKKK